MIIVGHRFTVPCFSVSSNTKIESKNECNERPPRIFDVTVRAGSPRSQGILNKRAARAPRGLNISHRGTRAQRNNTDINCRASVYRAKFYSDHQIINVGVENEWYGRSLRVFEVTVRAGSPRSQGIIKQRGSPRSQGINISHRGTKPQRNHTDHNCRASVYRAIFSDHQISNVGLKSIAMNGRQGSLK
jgi:hypothetical protein